MERRTVRIFESSYRGSVRDIALSLDDLREAHPLIRKNPRWRWRSWEESVAVVRGELLDWNESKSGYAYYLKLHWYCPFCNLQQWGNWKGDDRIPCLWYSNCECEKYWLIEYHWRPPIRGRKVLRMLACPTNLPFRAIRSRWR